MKVFQEHLPWFTTATSSIPAACILASTRSGQLGVHLCERSLLEEERKGGRRPREGG